MLRKQKYLCVFVFHDIHVMIVIAVASTVCWQREYKPKRGRTFGISGLTKTFLVDAKGRIVRGATGTGEWDSEETINLIRRCFEFGGGQNGGVQDGGVQTAAVANQGVFPLPPALTCRAPRAAAHSLKPS